MDCSALLGLGSGGQQAHVSEQHMYLLLEQSEEYALRSRLTNDSGLQVLAICWGAGPGRTSDGGLVLDRLLAWQLWAELCVRWGIRNDEIWQNYGLIWE